MEKYVLLNIKRLPEGYYLATSDSIQGLVAQGETFEETVEIARDLAKKLLEEQNENNQNENEEEIFYPMLINT